MSMETLWYEISPYVYAMGAMLTLGQAGSGSGLASLSGGLLLAAALIILRLRWAHRGARAELRRKARAGASRSPRAKLL
jgi:hypothetical protein